MGIHNYLPQARQRRNEAGTPLAGVRQLGQAVKVDLDNGRSEFTQRLDFVALTRVPHQHPHGGTLLEQDSGDAATQVAGGSGQNNEGFVEGIGH